jgi:hypothetical protein
MGKGVRSGHHGLDWVVIPVSGALFGFCISGKGGCIRYVKRGRQHGKELSDEMDITLTSYRSSRRKDNSVIIAQA